jgi:integrase
VSKEPSEKRKRRPNKPKKNLSAAYIEKVKPGEEPYEVSDAGSAVILLVHPSGAKSFIKRFRRPSGKHSKMTLGSYQRDGAPGAPAVGGPLSLAEARSLSAEVDRRRAAGEDVIVTLRADKEVRKAKAQGQGDDFYSVVRAYVREHRVRDRLPKGWKDTARLLGLHYSEHDGEPVLIKGGLAEKKWRGTAVGEITGLDCHDVIRDARGGLPGLGRKHGRGSENRSRKMASALGGFFRWVMLNRRRLLPNGDPMYGEPRPKAPKSRDRFLSDEEVSLLWRALDDPKVVYPFPQIIRMLLLTACRLNEVARLERKEVATVTVGEIRDCPALSITDRTKMGRRHEVPLSPLACEVLKGAREIEGCRWVFSITGRTPVSGWSKMKRRVDEEIARLNGGVPIEPFRLHDLRRTVRTGLSRLGVENEEVKEAILGHDKEGIRGTYDHYRYFGEKKAALDRWAAHVEGVVTGKPANVVVLKPKRAR